jgi:hypothetical protein
MVAMNDDLSIRCEAPITAQSIRVAVIKGAGSGCLLLEPIAPGSSLAMREDRTIDPTAAAA